MKILLICTRTPRPGGKGDESRAYEWISHLAARHDVEVLAPGAGSLPEHSLLAGVSWTRCEPTSAERLGAACLAALRRRSLQVSWMMPRSSWRRAVARSRRADVVLAMTARSLRGPLAAPVVLDHVDALSLNMRRRSAGPEHLAVRILARREARVLLEEEQRLARLVRAQIVTSHEDAAHLPSEPRIHVAPITVAPELVGAGYSDGHRPYDVVFSGNMRYPPNRDAAERLATTILPLIRRERSVRALFVGRAADELDVEAVDILSDVPDLVACLRTAKVALAPLTLGTGTPYKLVEAAAAGTAIVTTSWGAASLGLPCLSGDSSEDLAQATLILLRDEPRRRVLARAAHDQLTELTTPVVARQVEEILVRHSRIA